MAFLVGGCVRDLLLGMDPKDFDVATDALPEQVKRLFRNSRLVGRRFRLAHVFFGRDIIEVATFRATSAPAQGEEPLPEADPEDGEAPELDEPQSADLTFDASGRILRDNVYGTIDEDVWRRDFTANALYYNVADFSLWDYVGGAEDIAARTLRMIGDPDTRFREDPVRLLRAVRFEAKLGFHIDPATARPIGPLRELLAGVPAARLFDETLKLFLSGHGERSLEALRRRGLLATLLPSVERYFAKHPGSLPERWHELATILDACDQATREAQARLAIPKRFSLAVREMFALQPRLEHPRGRRALRLLEHPRFRAAYDLLLLRAEFGLAPRERAEWWTHLQEVSAEERGKMTDALAGAGRAPAGPGRRGRGRRRRRGTPAPA